MSNPYERILEAGQISFPDGTTWALNERLASEEVQDWEYPYEMRTVYSCTKVARAEKDDCEADMKAVVKIKMQINLIESDCSSCYTASEGRSSDKDCRRNRPSKFVHEHTSTEIAALRQLTNASCQSTPRLLDVKKEIQSEDDEFPGGYVIYILMTFLPGNPPYGFWKLPRGEKARIQKAFKEALGEVYYCGIIPKDKAIRNILWDKEGDRCFIVDFENVCFWSKATEHIDTWYVDDDLLPSWQLAERSCHGIDLYGDGSDSSYIPRPARRRNPSSFHPSIQSSLDSRRNTPKGTKDPSEGPLLPDGTNRSVPLEPLQISATTVSEADHQIERKASQRQSIRKLLAWCRPRHGSHLLRNLWDSFHKK